ncbi:response regulator [Pseudoalteromonas sp.]|uniref:response regulator n=1 Tax=Pseudoalteromonas sp. TaxID=53249 RepID=UPI002609EF1B|nr:response regulator [Pseudoalteromonas sp.]MCP3865855.1 response regulator [Aestuariibacter sp.]MCP4237085.1 response regulator [Aestuariibacter sp.]MCP4588920.1 response regulator [Pseudoalteromonas sp.]
MVSIIVAAEHELVRSGMKRLLNLEEGLSVVAEAASGEQVLALCSKLQPRVALIDISLLGIGAIETAKRVIRRFPNTGVVFISENGQLALVSQLMEAGVHGLITKDVSFDVMVEAIQAVAKGHRFLPQDIAQRLALSRFSVLESPFECLSERELSIAILLSKGAKPTEIAKDLSITSSTVNTYRYRMFEKLGIHSDVELVHLALFYKLISVNQKLCA